VVKNTKSTNAESFHTITHPDILVPCLYFLHNRLMLLPYELLVYFLSVCLRYPVYQKVKSIMKGSPGKININTHESKAGEVLKNENTELHKKQTGIRQYLRRYYMYIWLRHCSTNRNVAGSIPDGVTGINSST
jgi:predicted membrane protein